jgi:hypothetical protein
MKKSSVIFGVPSQLVRDWICSRFTNSAQHTSRITTLYEKLTVLQLLKKFPVYYAARKFITAFLRTPSPALVAILSQINPVHVFPTNLRSILILSSYQRLLLPSAPFLSGFPTKTLYAPLLFPIRAVRPIHVILLYLSTQIIFGEVPHSAAFYIPHYLVHRRSKYPPRHPILEHPYLCLSLNVTDQVSHPQTRETGSVSVMR